MPGTNTVKFLGLELDININWNNHVYKSLPEISSVYYFVRVMYPYSNTTTLKIIYFAYFHAVMRYGVIFWGSSVEGKSVFQQ